MNYKELLTGITNNQFEDICENWYARLNKLKQYRQDNHKVFHKDIQVNLLIDEMLERMSILTPIYIKYRQSLIPQPNFPLGGVVNKNINNSPYLSDREHIIPSKKNPPK